MKKAGAIGPEFERMAEDGRRHATSGLGHATVSAWWGPEARWKRQQAAIDMDEVEESLSAKTRCNSAAVLPMLGRSSVGLMQNTQSLDFARDDVRRPGR